MNQVLILNANEIAGSSGTVTKYVGTLTRAAIPRRAYLLTDTTITANGTNYWTFDLQASAVSFVTTTNTASADLTGGTARAITVTSTKVLAAGDEITLVMTKAASGADQSNSRFAVTLELEI